MDTVSGVGAIAETLWTSPKKEEAAMTGRLIIRTQVYEGVFSFGIFLETSEPIEGLDDWQDCDEIFVAYSRSEGGAQRAVRMLEQELG